MSTRKPGDLKKKECIFEENIAETKMVSDTKSCTMDEIKANKSIKNILKSLITFGGNKRNKGKSKKEPTEVTGNKIAPKNNGSETVDVLIETFDKTLKLEREKLKQVIQVETKQTEEEDEFDEFTVTEVEEEEENEINEFVVSEERNKTKRSDSNKSDESGFYDKDESDSDDNKEKGGVDKVVKKENKKEPIVEKKDQRETEKHDDEGEKDVKKKDTDEKDQDEADQVSESLGKLKIGDGTGKKTQTFTIARGPMRNRPEQSFHPYDAIEVNTVNRRSFSGGQVFVPSTHFNDDSRLQTLPPTQEFQTLPPAQEFIFDPPLVPLFPEIEDNLSLVDEYCQDKLTSENHVPVASGFDRNIEVNLDLTVNLGDLEQNPLDGFQVGPTEFYNFVTSLMNPDFQQTVANKMSAIPETDVLKEFDNGVHNVNETLTELDLELEIERVADHLDLQGHNSYSYPTPPRSDCTQVGSPQDSSFYEGSSTNTSPSYQILSPHSNMSAYMTSPNSDLERYVNIPSLPEPSGSPKEPDSKKNLPYFKALQKEMADKYRKRECCQMRLRENRRPCEVIFAEHTKDIRPDHKMKIRLEISIMNLDDAVATLKSVAWDLRYNNDGGARLDVNVNFYMFFFVAHRILGDEEMSKAYIGSIGQDLVKSTALRCPQYPLLTRYLVYCVRKAWMMHRHLVEDREFIFYKDRDNVGDTVVTACARFGDSHASVLAELLRRDAGEFGVDTADELIPLYDVMLLNTEGYSALHVACREHSALSPRIDIVHVLLVHGVDQRPGRDVTAPNMIRAGDVTGTNSAVHMAVNSPTCDLNMVLLLFNYLSRAEWKEFAMLKNMSSMTPLKIASEKVNRVGAGYPEDVAVFLKKCR